MQIQDRKGEVWKRSRRIHWADRRDEGKIDGQLTHIVEIEDRQLELSVEPAVDFEKEARRKEFRKTHHELCVEAANEAVDEWVEHMSMFRTMVSEEQHQERWRREYEDQQGFVAKHTEFDHDGQNDPETEQQVQWDEIRLKQVNAPDDPRRVWDRDESVPKPSMRRTSHFDDLVSAESMPSFFDDEEPLETGVNDLFGDSTTTATAPTFTMRPRSCSVFHSRRRRRRRRRRLRRCNRWGCASEPVALALLPGGGAAVVPCPTW